MLAARKTLFYLFILIYVVICPFLILYAFGYILNPDKGLSHTGIIHIVTNPPGAKILLENRPYKYRTPASLTGIIPGNYDIKVKLKDHRDWGCRVTVEAGKVSNFPNILLVPNMTKEEALLPKEKAEQLIAIPGSDFFILKQGNKFTDHKIYDLQTEKAVSFASLIPFQDRTTGHNIHSIVTQTNSKEIIISEGPIWNKRYWLLDKNSADKVFTDISDLLSDQPSLIVWPESEKHILFAVYEKSIERLDPDTMSKYPHFLDDKKGLGLSGKWLYVLDKNKTLNRMDFDKKSEIPISQGQFVDKDLFNQSRFYQIKALDDKLFLFIGDKGDVVLNLPPYKLPDHVQVQDFCYEQGQKRLLFWSKKSIWVAYTGVQRDKDELFQDSVNMEAVYEAGKNIKQCFWVFNGAYVLFLDNNQVKMASLPDKNRTPHSQLEKIVTTKKDSMIFFSEKNGQLYYLDEAGHLKRAEIVPRNNRILNRAI